MIQRKHPSPVICLWNLHSDNMLSQNPHVSPPSPFHSHSHQSHLQLPRSANQVHSQSQGQHDPSPPLFCDVLLHLFMAGWGWGVVVLRGPALSQAHKVVDVAVVDYAIARPHVLAETFHHLALAHEGVACTERGCCDQTQTV